MLVYVYISFFLFICLLCISKLRRRNKIYIVNQLVNSNNLGLWNDLCKEYKINLVKQARPYYMVYIKAKEATIYIDKNDIDSAKFTHELLHIKLDSQEIRPGKTLAVLINRSHNLSFLTSEGIDQIGNALEHIKMLPIFISMGYIREEFIHDYYLNKARPEVIDLVSGLKKNNIYSARYLDLYIVQFFCIIACPNNSFDYTSGLDRYASLDPELYRIINKIAVYWVKFNPDSLDIILSDYRWNFHNIINELDEWASDKLIK